MQRSHLLVTGEKGFPLSIISHENSCSSFCFFKSCINWLREVWFFSLYLKECGWTASLLLNSVEVVPMYVFVFPFVCFTVAL